MLVSWFITRSFEVSTVMTPRGLGVRVSHLLPPLGVLPGGFLLVTGAAAGTAIAAIPQADEDRLLEGKRAGARPGAVLGPRDGRDGSAEMAIGMVRDSTVHDGLRSLLSASFRVT